jgi:hypothetical protein
MEVSGTLKAQSLQPSARIFWYPLERKWLGRRAGIDRAEKRNAPGHAGNQTPYAQLAPY